MADQNHLSLRNHIWYYRRRVPTSAQAALGKAIIIKSLETQSLAAARRKRTALDLRYDIEFETAANLQPPSPGQASGQPSVRLSEAEIRQKIHSYIEREYDQFEGRFFVDPPADNAERYELAVDKREELSLLEDLDHPDQHRWVSAAFERMFSDTRFDGVSEAGVAELVRRALVQIARREIDLLSSDAVGSISDAGSPYPDGKRKGPTFGQVAAEFLAEEEKKASANNRRRQWVEKLRAHTQVLVELIGEGTQAADVDYQLGIRIRDLVARLPAHREKRFPGLSLETAMDRAETEGAALLSPASQKAYLDCFRNVMELAAAAHREHVGTNPVAKLTPLAKDPVSASDKRVPFSSGQLAQFFKSPFYDHWRPGGKPYSKDDRDWRFWLPLLMTYTGMRPQEVCQLQVADIRRSTSGVWWLSVDATERGQSDVKLVKTAHSRRSFPVHPLLIEVGFTAFVEALRSRKETRLFGHLAAGKRGYFSDYPCRRFRETFLPQAIEVEDRQSFYSFRHSFRDALRRINAPGDVVSALGGWSEGTKVSDAYGSKNDPDYLIGWVSKIEYPGVVLDFKYS